jgi:choline-sulfatase
MSIKRQIHGCSPFFTLIVAGTLCAAPLIAVQMKQDRPSVILVSVDTLRADHLGCYGGKYIPTPHIDALTRGGTLFSQIDSQVPMTLPSHTVLFTSTYPFWNRTEENGERVPGGAVTLAAVLRLHGYHTAAFIGGFVLDRRFGLDQGFEIYDSPFAVHQQPGNETISLKRPAPQVTQAASNWVRSNSDQPFFVFLHIFDLHMPYEFPPHYARLDGDEYDSELGNIDQVLGRFWHELDRMGLFKRSLIIFTSDHGESLGDHGEQTHGYFIYESTLHVPLIIHWPAGSDSYPAQVTSPASLIDVAPTILQFLNIPAPKTFQGRTLLGALPAKASVAPRAVYSESLYARDHFDCSPLRSLRIGQYKYIEAPHPELYNLAQDPAETHNLYLEKRMIALEMERGLLALRSRYAHSSQPSQQAPSAETQALLSSLGYTALMSRHNAADESGPDPKDRLAEYQDYRRAIEFASNGNHSKAIRAFGTVLKDDPNNVLAHFYLAVTYHRVHEFDDAVKQLQETLQLDPGETRAQELLGTIWLEERDYSRAQQSFEHLLELAPEDYGANYNLGVLAARHGQWTQAIRYLRTAVAADPQSFLAHGSLGLTYLETGQASLAIEEFQRAARLEPGAAGAHYNLGLAWRDLRRFDLAAQEFRKALAIDPGDRRALKALAHLPASATN